MRPAPRFHPEILTQDQARVLAALAGAATSYGFYMAGGTALALQLGHRRSVDFDWFRREEIPDPLRLGDELAASMPDLRVLSTSNNTLHAESDGVSLSWFSYSYDLLEPLVDWSDGGCRLASLRDIAAMKVAAIAQRGAKKDFFDLVAIGKTGLSLDQMLDAYRTKFGITDIGHVLVSLTWFEDAENDPAPILNCADDWKSIRSTVLEWTLKLAR